MLQIVSERGISCVVWYWLMHLKKGHQTSFACQCLVGDLIQYIEKRGHGVIRLDSVSNMFVKNAHCGYESWLQRSQIEDAEDFLRHVKAADVVVTDHYAIGLEMASADQRIIRL